MLAANLEQRCFLPSRSEAGFTLLEVMVAVSIIALSFVSLLGSQSQSISIAADSRFATISSMLAGQKLAEMQVNGFEELSSTGGDFEDDFAGFNWQTEVNELTEDEIGIKGGDGLLKVVDLTVSRGDDELSYQVRSVIMVEIEPEEKK